MASSEGKLCDNCEHRHISTAAVTWCPDCDEALCSECKDHHDASKIAKFHKTISLTEFDKLPPFIKKTSVYCTDHDHKCDFYCSSHQQSCCNVCLKESHFQCEKLDILQDVVNNVKTSTMLEDIENDLKCSMTNLDSLIKNRLENKTRINDQKFACIEEIQTIRKLFNDKLDNMEKSLKDTLQSDVEEVVSDLDNLLKELDIRKSVIHTLQKELETVRSIATDLQVFLGLRPLELRLEEEHAYLETLKTNKAMDEVELVLSIAHMRAIFESSESFGVISQSRKHNDLEFGLRKKGQAQLFLPSVKEVWNIKFSEKATFQLANGKYGIEINGCIVLPGEMLVFTDTLNYRLIICHTNGTFVRDIKLSFKPSYITYVNNSTVAVTTLSSKKTVVLIELITGKELSSFSTGGTCYGLCYRNEMLTLRNTGFFLKTTLQGEIKSSFRGDALTHCCAVKDRIISSNGSNNSVLCYETNGDLAWLFKDPKLQTPRDVTVDENGCVLVVGEKSNNLFAISPDGKSGREVVNALDKPYAIHFDQTSKLMVIANDTGSAKVYQKK